MEEAYPNLNIADAENFRKAKVKNVWKEGNWRLPDHIDPIILESRLSYLKPTYPTNSDFETHLSD